MLTELIPSRDNPRCVDGSRNVRCVRARGLSWKADRMFISSLNQDFDYRVSSPPITYIRPPLNAKSSGAGYVSCASLHAIVAAKIAF
jgi:hypothetical protein